MSPSLSHGAVADGQWTRLSPRGSITSCATEVVPRLHLLTALTTRVLDVRARGWSPSQGAVWHATQQGGAQAESVGKQEPYVAVGVGTGRVRPARGQAGAAAGTPGGETVEGRPESISTACRAYFLSKNEEKW